MRWTGWWLTGGAMLPDALLAEDAERAVCGALLNQPSPDLRARIAQLVTPEMFASAACREVYRVLVALAEAGVESPDPLAVRNALVERGTLAVVGGLPVLAELVDTVPTAANGPHHAQIVRDRALRRQVWTASHSAALSATDLERPLADVLTGAVSNLSSFATQQAPHGTHAAGDVVFAVLDQLTSQRSSDGPADGVTTGLADLDTLLGGYAPGRLVVAAARPGVGKSTFALHAALSAARHGAVYFLSLEMSEDELVRRCLASLAGVNLRASARGPSDADVAKLMRAGGELKRLPILIDTASSTVAQLRLALERVRTTTPVALVVVDYLTLLRSAKRHERRDLEVGAFARDLKMDVARACQVPVLALAQLRRTAQGEAPREPRLDDLRESGEIEQHADQVVMLHYAGREDGRSFDPGDGHRPGWGPATKTVLCCRKNRHGAMGTFPAFYDRTIHRWGDWSERTPAQEVA